MKQATLLIISIFCVCSLFAQQPENCKVLSDSIRGTYTGDCKNGKANGIGKAVGMHTYEGEFKNGLPEGKGKYTWSNGDFYDGNWKKGMKEGRGELHRFVNGKETLVEGYWKKDNYRGEYENPYVITNVTNDIGRVQIAKIEDKSTSITITVESLQSSTTLTRGSFQTGTVMTAHQVTRGAYISKSSSALTNKEVTVFRGVVFPFRCTFNFGSSMIEIEFFDAGSWDVVVPISK